MADWAELRVHGVSGTPPEAVLGPDPLEGRSTSAQRCWSRGRSATYRRRDGAGNWVRDRPDQVLEAFHWGEHTSGSRGQALWLLLLPFGMANAAQFMLPRAVTLLARFLRAACSGVLRLLAAVLTLLFSLALTVGVLDLLMWQWLAPTGWLPDRAVPAVLAVGVGVCGGSVFVLSRLGRAGRLVGETARRTGPLLPGRTALEDPFRQPGDLHAAEPPGFSSPDFFAGDPDAPTLRRLHLSLGLLGVAVLAWSAVQEVSGGRNGVADVAMRWTVWALIAVGVLVLLLGDAPGAALRAPDAGGSAWGRVAAGLGWLALAVAVTAASVAIVALARTSDPTLPSSSDGGLPAVDWAILWVAAIGTAALIGLALLVVLLALTTPEDDEVPGVFRRFAHGWAAALVAGLSLFVGVGFTAAATYVAQFLFALVNVVLRGPEVHITPLLERVAFAWGVLLVVLGVLAAGILVWLQRRAPGHAADAQRVFLRGSRVLPPERAREVGKAVVQARLKSLLPVVLLVIAVTGAVLTVVLAAEQWRGPCVADPCGAAAGLFQQWRAIQERAGWGALVLTGLGVLVLLALAVVLFRIGLKAFRGTEARRSVNVLWDVISFWPRATHPFVPEPYSQDVVRDLRDRIAMLLQETGTTDGVDAQTGRVVVAAHSQGSLVALAALRSLPTTLCKRVGVLTFGSQLRVLFPRAFPAHVSYEVVAWLADCFGDRWVSLYRETDYIGGPVASWDRNEPESPGQLTSCRLGVDSGPVEDGFESSSLRRSCGREWRLIDPPVDPSTGSIGPGLRKHSDYWSDPSWGSAVHKARTGVEETVA